MQEYFVSCYGLPSGDGTEDNPYQTINQALEAIPDEGDCIIWVMKGQYNLRITRRLSFRWPVILKSVTLYDAEIFGPFFLENGANLHFEGFTFHGMVTL